MKIKIIPAVLYGILLWLLIFVEVSIVMFMPALKDQQLTQSIIHLIILPILVLIVSYLYFKNKEASLINGLVLGVIFLVVGTILDLAITIPLFVKNYNFFMQWSLWVGFLEVIIFSSLMGWIKK